MYPYIMWLHRSMTDRAFPTELLPGMRQPINLRQACVAFLPLY